MWAWYGKLYGYMISTNNDNKGIEARINQKAKRTKPTKRGRR